MRTIIADHIESDIYDGYNKVVISTFGLLNLVCTRNERIEHLNHFNFSEIGMHFYFGEVEDIFEQVLVLFAPFTRFLIR